MQKNYFAPLGFVDGRIYPNVRVSLNAERTITQIELGTSAKAEDIIVEGLLSPGFVNAHTHLELSNLKGAIPKGKGMVAFLENIVKLRNDALLPNDLYEQIIASGTVALGDIANSALTAKFKAEHTDLYFHTFIELLSNDPTKVDAAFMRGKELAQHFKTPVSLVPHAPFSVSEQLIQKCIAHLPPGGVISIHFMESLAERIWLSGMQGELCYFLANMGLNADPATTTQPIEWLQNVFDKNTKIGLVHCTELIYTEIEQILCVFKDCYFVLCPRANTYINSRVPFLPAFNPVWDRVCIGTDSLASNDSLDPLTELIHLKRNFAYLSTEMLLTAATHNGAKFLGIENKFGVLAVGLKPGLLVIEGINIENPDLTEQTRIKRLDLPTH